METVQKQWIQLSEFLFDEGCPKWEYDEAFYGVSQHSRSKRTDVGTLCNVMELGNNNNNN